MTLPANEFLRRFLLRVLPKGLVRIRHFGLFANRTRSAMLALCRSLLGPPLASTSQLPDRNSAHSVGYGAGRSADSLASPHLCNADARLATETLGLLVISMTHFASINLRSRRVLQQRRHYGRLHKPCKYRPGGLPPAPIFITTQYHYPSVFPTLPAKTAPIPAHPDRMSHRQTRPPAAAGAAPCKRL